MAATRDNTCALIERECDRQAANAPGWHARAPGSLLGTPHAERWVEQIGAASTAAAALMDIGCLVSAMHVTADRATLTLHRAPPAGALGYVGYTVDARGEQPMASLEWYGIRVEWPEAVAS